MIQNPAVEPAPVVVPQVTALAGILQMIGQYGLPLVVSVVLLGYVLIEDSNSNRQQSQTLAAITATQELISKTLDRINSRLDIMDARMSSGGVPLVPVR